MAFIDTVLAAMAAHDTETPDNLYFKKGFSFLPYVAILKVIGLFRLNIP